ncbi:MAG: SPFH domain-containing protein [Planctomycetota bacterium]|nr:SPFH domain-containing protein [Planctomycetota bacterium]MDG2142420.1 SPFH domain-containing protein [Planctomycetota bacterium]
MGWKTSTAKFAWKIVKPFVLIWLIWSITGYVSAKGTGLFLVHVQPWQAAVQQGNFSGGLSEHDLAPGLHVNIPGFDSVHVVDMGRRMTSFGVDSDPKSLNAIDLRTSDDNVVALSTAILWKVKPGTAHSIVARALVETLPTQVALTAAEVLRREFASMGSEAWFDADGRVLLTSQIEPKLAAELAALHVDLDGIYIQGFAFSNDLEVKLQEIQINHQKGLLFDAVSRVEEASGEVGKLVNETKSKVQQLMAEWDQERQGKQIAAGLKKATLIAEAKALADKTKADADAAYDVLVTQGQLAYSLASEQSKRLHLEALNSEGGRIWLARKAAGQLNVEHVWLDSRDPNVPSMIDLDEMTKLLLGGK